MMDVAFDLDRFWQYLTDILRQLERHHYSDNTALAEQLLMRADDCQTFLRAVWGRVSELTGQNSLIADIESLIGLLGEHCAHLREWTLRQEAECLRLPTGTCTIAPYHSVGPGRPPFDIKKEDLESLMEIGLNFRQISRIVGVSERTIRRRRAQYGLPVGNNYSSISDGDLDFVIANILQMTMDSGISMVRGALLARGIIVQRQRVIDAMHRVDPISQCLRRTVTIYRRQYSVPGPNSLWHVDGNHKLIRWKMVVHGGIDGFSRLVTFLKCSNNNRADTALTCFREAVQSCGIPSRIRCDLGVENVDIARFMLATRGVGRSSVLSGSSTHNQRIERLWRDVRRVVLRHYQNLFNYLEAYNLLDPLLDIHLLALHHVYIPRINQALEEFVRQHNNHPLRTEHNMTPRQLFTVAPTSSDAAVIDPVTYGVEEDGPIPDIESPDNSVVVNPPVCVISPQVEATLPHPLSVDGNYGINLYIQVLSIIQNNV